MIAQPERVLLGKDSAIAYRARIYRRGDTLEVDVSDHWSISRRRVLFEDVVLVTLHRARRVAAPLVFALLASPFLLLALLPKAVDDETARSFLLGCGIPLAAIALAIALLPNWFVTVQGRRARARLQVGPLRRRARAVYRELVAAIAQAQARARADAPTPPSPEV